jgi:hypothetical protein
LHQEEESMGYITLHTGGIDGMWKISKGAVSSSWGKRKNGTINPQ